MDGWDQMDGHNNQGVVIVITSDIIQRRAPGGKSYVDHKYKSQ